MQSGTEFFQGIHPVIIAVACINRGTVEAKPSMTSSDENEQRLDKWLWHCRFYKTRSLATASIAGGKVHLNAERVKPPHRVRRGDRLSLSLQGVVAEFEVLGLPQRRGPAAEAAANYLETPESAQRRLRLREQQRLAQLSRPRPEARPDKRDRRRLMRLQRDQT
jgi:ribosome-associated heat shock protein Hsp15